MAQTNLAAPSGRRNVPLEKNKRPITVVVGPLKSRPGAGKKFLVVSKQGKRVLPPKPDKQNPVSTANNQASGFPGCQSARKDSHQTSSPAMGDGNYRPWASQDDFWINDDNSLLFGEVLDGLSHPAVREVVPSNMSNSELDDSKAIESTTTMETDYEQVWGQESFNAEPQAAPAQDSVFGIDPMACFNPLDVEGKIPQSIDDDAPTAAESANDDFDLLDFVTNSSLPVNDPSFMSYCEDLMSGSVEEPEVGHLLDTTLKPEPIDSQELKVSNLFDASPETEPVDSSASPVEISVPEPVTSTVNLEDVSMQEPVTSTVNLDDIAVPSTSSKRSRGSPRKRVEAPSSAKDHSYGVVRQRAARVKSKTKEAKYRRMRDLNNAASKRCRQNRKLKMLQIIDEERALTDKNRELKLRVKAMEDQVAALKSKFLERIVNPPAPKATSSSSSSTSAASFDIDSFIDSVFDINH